MKAILKNDVYTHNAENDKQAGQYVTVEKAGTQFMRFYGRDMAIYRDIETGCTYTANILEFCQADPQGRH